VNGGGPAADRRNGKGSTGARFEVLTAQAADGGGGVTAGGGRNDHPRPRLGRQFNEGGAGLAAPDHRAKLRCLDAALGAPGGAAGRPCRTPSHRYRA